MKKSSVYADTQSLEFSTADPVAAWVSVDGIPFYRIKNYDRMPPFFMTVVSNSDHWMFISSTGGVTCGRRDPDHALFPYYTDDKIHDAPATTGPFTALRIHDGRTVKLWLPFSDRYAGIYRIERRLLKSRYGNRIIFEEENLTLRLTFRYSWESSRRFGFVRRAGLVNHADTPLRIDLLDGLRNILPAGVDRASQERSSTLLDAYKQGELVPGAGLGLFSLSSILTDRAEPSEALEASTVWQSGLENPTTLLSEGQIREFVEGAPLRPEESIRGRRGAYLLGSELTVPASQQHEWIIVADAGRDSADVTELVSLLADGDALRREVESDIAAGTGELRRLVASADGLQLTADTMAVNRHWSNVLFNIMRGGIFSSGYTIDSKDFRTFCTAWNRELKDAERGFFEALPECIQHSELIRRARESENSDLIRLVDEYLPLSFSRRHGDPSRPWNRFVIELERADGRKSLAWQGNWRDIFQNWEALAHSYPDFLPGMIAKFLNASTADGYNPYRISREGIDWEIFDPDDPWSNIGYWGDHQIVYLWRLLELSRRFNPGALEKELDRRHFVFADIPYRITTFEKILENPQDTISYDNQHAHRIDERVLKLGADGKLYHNGGTIYHASLAEKLLIPVLTKLSNLVPDGGIWMNTQRPEWNDANNALVGWGLSMVTLAYLRRFISFLLDLLPLDSGDSVQLTLQLAEFLRAVSAVFKEFAQSGEELLPRERMDFVRAMGEAGTVYRETVYKGSFGTEATEVSYGEIGKLLSMSRGVLDNSIRANRRSDGLYHSYNIMSVSGGGITIDHLNEMLEGQVAVLSADLLAPDEAEALLAALRSSPLYRPDANSYMLYPDKSLPSFLMKNRLSTEQAARTPLIRREAAREDGRIFRRDATGVVHFNSAFRNARELSAALDRIGSTPGEPAVTPEERELVLSVYEEIFRHREFTGRSGTFFKYEGLGSIYWHMVSKLALAVQENWAAAVAAGADQELCNRLADRYTGIKAGIGVEKSPVEYGAVPSDPYSHTPGFAGVQQPGMTGQVKEDIIARFGELGVDVVDGRLSFRPRLLKRAEFLVDPAEFEYLDLDGEWQTITLRPGMLAFCCFQMPVIYTLGSAGEGVVTLADGSREECSPRGLSRDLSRSIFERSGRVVRVTVNIDPRDLHE